MYTRALTSAEILSTHLEAAAKYTLDPNELVHLEDGEQVVLWDAGTPTSEEHASVGFDPDGGVAQYLAHIGATIMVDGGW